MSAHWLTFQSFQQGQELLEAINLLSIHAKLQRRGVADAERAKPAQESREKIKAFLLALLPLVEQAEENHHRPLLGIDLRRRQLVNRFLEAKRDSRRFRSALFRKPVSEIMRLLETANEVEQQQLIDWLAELRVLIEEHTNPDTVQLLGEI